MRFVYSALNWIFGAIFLLAAMGSLAIGWLPAIAFVAISLLLLPPARKFLHSKTNIEIPLKGRALAITALIFSNVFFLNQGVDKEVQALAERQAKERSENATAERQKTIRYFNANRQRIITDTKNFIEAGAYPQAITLSSKYLEANSVELTTLNTLARDKLEEKQSVEHIAEAKRALDEWKPNVDPMKATWGRVNDAEKHIEAIKPGDKLYSEAKILKREIERRKTEISRLSYIVGREVLIKQLEESYLKKGLDVYVSSLGKNKDTLRLKFVLFSRPLVHNLANDSDFIGGLRAAGFKKIIFTDGYDSSWTLEL